ncbi:hypothetical protein Q1J45_24270 [Pseudomonas rhodesiae]|nr:MULTISPECIES: hypothetical protein [unclassified Pseudomonas]WLH43579.1 hypothetical protein PSH94_15410 [Pseudomonas sp. FP2254]
MADGWLESAQQPVPISELFCRAGWFASHQPHVYRSDGHDAVRFVRNVVI